MQTQAIQKDHRAAGVRRVALDTLVELCGQEPDMPAFEGRSVNVSGRGMLVESDFLPPTKTALVMRFEHEGREVVVEGLVAWRDKSGGRFGVRFTALDSKSVVVLKQLCGQAADDAEEHDEQAPESKPNSPLFAELDDSHTPQPVITTTVGAPMKLHIAGLAAPMKARVVDGKSSRLRVGSQLDFLKLGRSLEVEDLSLGVKREANVHSVDVQVDAGSGIPQLVVTLRWNGSGEDITPAPVVSSSKRRPAVEDDYFTKDELTSPGKQSKRSVPPRPATRASQPEDERSDDDYEDEDDEFNTAEALLKSRVALWATALSRGVRSASERVASASRGTGQLLQDLVKRAPIERPTAKTKGGPVRSTRRLNKDTIPPGQSRAPRRSQFPQSGRPAANAPAPSSVTLKRSHLVVGSAATLCVGLGLYFFGASSKPEAPDLSGRELAPLAAGETARALPVSPAPVAALPADGISPQAAAMRRQPLDTEQQLRTDTHGMVANVPLFGPTQMATTEPAPDADEPVAAAPRKLGVDEVSLAKDESFSDKVVAEPVEQASQRVFQVGRMNLPVIHRLRLDAPAELLQGEKTPNGFSVLVPGRKVMETGAGISSRDERITQVSAKNTPAGARVTFRFGKEIPGYKARLRNDYLEFFINSP